VNKQKLSLQARHGYFAPHGETDPEATAREEIRQAVFSQEEMRELPIECQTQFFKGDTRPTNRLESNRRSPQWQFVC